MHIECIKEKLDYALSKTERLTGKNISLPILNCVLLIAKDSTLTLRATNLDVGVEINIPAKVIKEGQIAVPGTLFKNFISYLSQDKNIVLEEVSGNVKISTKNSETVIKYFPVNDFPTIPMLSGESLVFNSFDFMKGLKSVMYAASSSSLRPALSSILVYYEDESLVFVATDSFRLAEKRIKSKKIKEFEPILIPCKNIQDIIRTFEDIKDDFSIILNENQISFSYKDIYMTSRLVDGSFPDYKQIIPKEVKTEVSLLKQDFVNTLKLSNIFSDKFSQVIFDIQPTKNTLTTITKNMEIGEHKNTLQAVVKGDSLVISFNYKYITDCFQSIESDSLAISFVDMSKPMIIRGISDKTFTYLVMPMNK